MSVTEADGRPASSSGGRSTRPHRFDGFRTCVVFLTGVRNGAHPELGATVKRPWVFWLGILGFLGLIGPLMTGNPYLAGFLWFFAFFGWRGIANDERLELTVGRASRNAVLAGVLGFACAAIAVSLPHSSAYLLPNVFVAAFAVQMLVFSISLVFYNHARVSL